MNVAFRSSFARDLSRITDKSLLRRIREAIENVEHAQSITDLPNLKKLKSSKNYYRLRIGDYRIGLAVEDDVLVCAISEPQRDLQILSVSRPLEWNV